MTKAVVPAPPEVFDVIQWKGGEIVDLPDTTWPFYVVSYDGFFMMKRTPFGRVLVREKYFPEHYESLGDAKKGWFRFDAPRVSASVMSQALDFFRIVFKEISAEAEVLLLMNLETKEYDLFVPYQVVAHGKVDSIYDIAHIPAGWDVVGTIHSHCDFSAFHSGIDEGDARGFNGLHITIGHVNTDNPSFDAMVMINEVKFQYKIAESVAEIENGLDLLAAPDAWYNDFVFTTPVPILALDFPSLTREELDEFGKKTSPKFYTPVTTVYGIPTTETPKHTWQGGGSNYQQTTWSDEFKKNFPSEWFETGGGWPRKLKPEFFKIAMEKVLDGLYEMCEERELFLDAKIFPLAEVELLTAKAKSAVDVDDEDDALAVTAADSEIIMAVTDLN